MMCSVGGRVQAARPASAERSAHQLEKIAPSLDVLGPLGGLVGELPVQHLLEALGPGEVFQAAPVVLAARGLELRAGALSSSLSSRSAVRSSMARIATGKGALVLNLVLGHQRLPSVSWFSAGL